MVAAVVCLVTVWHLAVCWLPLKPLFFVRYTCDRLGAELEKITSCEPQTVNESQLPQTRIGAELFESNSSEPQTLF